MLSLLNHQKTYFRIWCSGVEGHFFPISLNQFREGPCLLYIHPFGYADAVTSAQTTYKPRNVEESVTHGKKTKVTQY